MTATLGRPLSTLVQAVLRRRGLTARRLDDRAWLVDRTASPLSVHRVGPRELRTHVVSHPGAVRRQANGYQNQMAHHLGEEHLGWVLRDLRVNCVLDVGANRGQFASRLRRAGYTGRIVSFEPVGHLVEALREASAGDPDWWVRDHAAGAEDGTAEINVVPGKMSSLLPASTFGRAWSERLAHPHPETIRIRRLDSVYDEVVAGIDEPRVFLKLDTQGFDLEAVRGAGERLGEVLGLQSEVSCLPIYDGMPHWIEQLAEYERAGFAVSGMFVVTRHRRSLRAIEFDVVMVRDQAPG